MPVWQPNFPEKEEIERLRLIATYVVINGPEEKREAARGVVATLYWMVESREPCDELKAILGEVQSIIES